jgi:hypothetical protein
MSNRLVWRTGGNPPSPPRLYRGTTVIADWPAGYEPTRTIVSLVEMTYDAMGTTLTRDEVRALVGGMSMTQHSPSEDMVQS